MIDIDFKEAFNPIGEGRQIEYQVNWFVVNERAQESAELSAVSEPGISRPSQVTNRRSTALNFASFELGGFPLDGSAVVPPRPHEMPDAEIGLILQGLSDANGNFISARTVTLTLPEPESWLALTINWGRSPAIDFEVEYYNGDTLLHTTAVTDNTLLEYVDMYGAEDCDKVVISVTKAAPYRRVHIAEVSFGAMRTHDKTNTISFDITENFDPLNERTPANELRLEVENFAEEYNIYDPDSISEFIQTGQEIKAKIGAVTDDGTHYVDMGTYYLTDVENKGNNLTIKAVNLIGKLQNTSYTTGKYKTASFAEFAQDVAADAGVTVSFPSSFSERNITAYIPSVSHAEAFRRIAQATMTYLYVNRDNIIVFADPYQIKSYTMVNSTVRIMLNGKQIEKGVIIHSNRVQQTMTQDDYIELTPSTDKHINTVEVEAIDYTVAEEKELLVEKRGGGNEHSVRYNPAIDVDIFVFLGVVTAKEIYVDNANFTANLGEFGRAQLTGRKLIENKELYIQNNRKGNEPPAVYSIKGNSLIAPAIAPSVANHYLKMKAVHNRITKMTYRGYPYIEMADCINFDNGKVISQGFIVTKNTLRLAGGMTGTLEAREAVS